MFEFGEARMVDGDKGAGVGVVDQLGELMACEKRAWEICLVMRKGDNPWKDWVRLVV